jgi:SAM-dependent methyltransferase
MIFNDSALAHQYLDGLGGGIEIGASAHNPFHIPGTVFVDFTVDATTWTDEQITLCGMVQHIDVVADAAKLPFAGESQGFVLSSHVLEHMFDPIATLIEWDRVVRPGGIIFAIVPKRDALDTDKPRPLTPLHELVDRHEGRIPTPERDDHQHWTVWTHHEGEALVRWIMRNRGMRWTLLEVQPTDDKVGNGWTVVIRKIGSRAVTSSIAS